LRRRASETTYANRRAANISSGRGCNVDEKLEAPRPPPAIPAKSPSKVRIGDLGQARGGPAPDGHASHQNGLDVDLRFVPSTADDTVSMVDAARRRPSSSFTEEMVALLRSAGRVDRIFIKSDTQVLALRELWR